MKTQVIFYQLFENESSTYTYLIADPLTKEAALIDTVKETIERDLKLVSELGLHLKYVLDTHIHADHITGAGLIRQKLPAKTAVAKAAQVDCADILLSDGDQLQLGALTINVIATPGHTDSCLSYVFEGMVFTGDALLIGGTGRTDFQGGSSEKLYHSVREKLFLLPDETIVYPAHDYKGQTSSTIGQEKKNNPRIGLDKTKEAFFKIMETLKLAQPKKIHEALPANKTCGLAVAPPGEVPEIGVKFVVNKIPEYQLIDVRNQDEFNGPLGHIKEAKLVTLGPELSEFLRQSDRHSKFIFVCRSGKRSKTAALEAIDLGYTHVMNMTGGMLDWNEQNLPKD